MRTIIAVLLCFIIVLAAAAQKEIHPKLAQLSGDEQYIHVTGIWFPDVRTKETELVAAVVDYTCYRHGGRDLVGTDSFCLEVTATPIAASINVDTTFYKVITWSKTTIQATTDDDAPEQIPCRITDVTFNLGLKSVTSVDRKKPIANRIDICKGLPDHVSYALYDKIEVAVYGKPK